MQRKRNCGCPYCRGEGIPVARAGWKGRKNRLGHPYGSTKKACKGKGKIQQRSVVFVKGT